MTQQIPSNPIAIHTLQTVGISSTSTSTSQSSTVTTPLHHLVPDNLKTAESSLATQVIFNENPNPFSVDSPHLWSAPIPLDILIDSIFTQQEAQLIRHLFDDASNTVLLEKLKIILLNRLDEIKNHRTNYSHKDVLYYFHFYFHLFSVSAACESLQPTFDELFSEMAGHLSIEEQGQLVRFASLLESPFEKTSDDFRAAIKENVYREVKRLNPLKWNDWISVQKTLEIILDQINTYLHAPEKIFEDYELDKYFKALTANDLTELLHSLKERCGSDLTDLLNGKERHLSKWFVSLHGRVFATTVFNYPLAALKKSQTVTLSTACEGTMSLFFSQNVEWDPANIKKIYRDVQSHLQLECENIVFYNCNLKNEIKTSDLGVAVIGNHLPTQVLTFSKDQMLNDIKILSLLEARLLNTLLSQFPLYIPAYLPEPTDIYPVAAPHHSASPSPHLSPTKREAGTTANPPQKRTKRNVTDQETLSALKEVDAGRGLTPFLMEWKEVLSRCLSEEDTTLFGKNIPQSSPLFNEIQKDGIKIPIFENLKGICPVRTDCFFKLIEVEPQLISQAILADFLRLPENLNPITFTLGLESDRQARALKARLNRLESNQQGLRMALKARFNFSDKDFPKEIVRGTWNTFPSGSLNIINPLLLFNRKSVQTMLFTHARSARQKILLFDETGFWEKVMKKDPMAVSRFFAYVALEIIQASTENSNDSIRCPVFQESKISLVLDYNSFDRCSRTGFRENLNEPQLILKAYNFLEGRQKEQFGYYILGENLSRIPKEVLDRFETLSKLLFEMGKAIHSRYFFPSDATVQGISSEPLQKILAPVPMEELQEYEQELLNYPALYPADLYQENLFN